MRYPVALLLLAASWAVHGHGVEHRVASASATVVELRYGDGRPFSYESYEVRRDDEEVPFQTGRTDALGRVVFMPDGAGQWQVRVFSEDGHGVDLRVQAGAGELAGIPTGPGRVWKVLTGVAVLFGLFGLWAVFVRGRRS